jgi:hypothetical protein
MRSRAGASDELGPLLFTQQHSRAEGIAALLIAVALMTLGPVGYYFAAQDRNRAWAAAMMVMGPMIGFVVLLVGINFMLLSRYIYHVHERGVRRTKADQVESLWYDAVVGVTYDSQELLHLGGAIVDSAEKLTLYRASGTPFKLFKHRGKSVRNQPTPIRAICDRACAPIVRRMTRELASGKVVDWASGFRLEPAGVRTPRGTLIEWADLQFEPGNGRLHLRSIQKRRRINTILVKAKNFYPGLFAAKQRTHGLPAADQTAKLSVDTQAH